MALDLSTFLRAAQSLGPALSVLPAVRQVLDVAVATLGATDQAVAKEALADLIADNDDGHARLQAKLEAASKA